MIVCIAEKPSVAREIANVLGAKQSHDGYIAVGAKQSAHGTTQIRHQTH